MKTLAALILSAGLATTASAHEYWFEAPDHRVEEGGQIAIGTFVGSDLVGQQMPYFPRSYLSLRHFAPGAEPAFVPGRLGALPAFTLADLAEGLHVIAVETRNSSLTYDDPEKFANFLRNEGIAYILDEHRARGLPESGFAETYSRSAKTLIGVGSAEGSDVVAGMTVELVALDNPFTSAGPIGLRFDVRSTPKADARVNLFHRTPAGVVSETPLTTDAEGVATVPDLGPGFYLANAVQMEPVNDLGPTAWHSNWASLTWTR